MYAIRNKNNKKWVYGTDYRYGKPRQRISYENALLFEYKEFMEMELRTRRINPKYYEVIEVELMEKNNEI